MSGPGLLSQLTRSDGIWRAGHSRAHVRCSQFSADGRRRDDSSDERHGKLEIEPNRHSPQKAPAKAFIAEAVVRSLASSRSFAVPAKCRGAAVAIREKSALHLGRALSDRAWGGPSSSLSESAHRRSKDRVANAYDEKHESNDIGESLAKAR